MRLRIVMDDWTRPAPGTMEIDSGAGTIRIWLREGEFVIPRGAMTVEEMITVTELARNGMLNAAAPGGITLRNGNMFQIAPGAITITLA